MQVSRRIKISGDGFTATGVRREVFRAAVSYGLVELFSLEGPGSLVVQFQRISSAQRMLTDLSEGGRSLMHAEYVPALNHVGARLLVFSTNGNAQLKLPASVVSAAAGCQVATLVPACCCSQPVLQQLVELQALAPLLSTLCFPSVLEANLFLERSQAQLSHQPDATQEAFVWHVGPDVNVSAALAVCPIVSTVEEATARLRKSFRCVVVKAAVPGGGGGLELDCGIVTKKGRAVPVLAKSPAGGRAPQQGDFLEVELVAIAEDVGRATLLNPKVPTAQPSLQACATPLTARLLSVLHRSTAPVAGPQPSSSPASLLLGLHCLPAPLRPFDVVSMTVTSCLGGKLLGTTTGALSAGSSGGGSENDNSAENSPTVRRLPAVAAAFSIEVPECFMPVNELGSVSSVVAGERLSACIVAATAIGGSVATLKLVGSLRRADLDHRRRQAARTNGGQHQDAGAATLRGLPLALWTTGPAGPVWLFQLLGGQAESGVVNVLLPSPDVVEGKPMDAHVISRSAHAVVLRSTAVGPPNAEQPPPVTLTSSAVSKAVDDALFAVFGEQPEDSGRKRPRPD